MYFCVHTFNQRVVSQFITERIKRKNELCYFVVLTHQQKLLHQRVVSCSRAVVAVNQPQGINNNKEKTGKYTRENRKNNKYVYQQQIIAVYSAHAVRDTVRNVYMNCEMCVCVSSLALSFIVKTCTLS